MAHTVRVRFAPSPTGELHLGSARTALFNYLFAKQKKGKFYLRIEDTDVKRSKEEYGDQILSALKWLKLFWDDPIVFQSRRIEFYQQSAKLLLKSESAYRCFCTTDELSKEKEEAMKKTGRYRYSGKCGVLTPHQIRDKVNSAQPYCIRLKIPSGKTSFTDMIHGKITVSHNEIDDFVILRTDGTPTYNLTVVVDDSDMEITHVIRGDDHLSNTPKQILIYKALERKIPKFAHLPMILGSNMQRLSKRHGAMGVQEYQKMGYLSEALLNYLVLLGWSPGDDRELFTLDELIKEFSLNQVSKKGAIFDEKKLHWIGGQHMAKQSAQFLLQAVGEIFQSEEFYQNWLTNFKEEYLSAVIELVKSRTKTLRELVEFSRYFFENPKSFDPKAVKQRWDNESVSSHLKKYLSSLRQLENWEIQTLEAHLRRCAEEFGILSSALIHPVRIAITGQGVGPPLFQVMALLGKEAVCRRINFAIENLPSKFYIKS